MEQYGVVYKITNLINGKSYIGQTINSLQVRFKGHLYSANKLKVNSTASVCRKIGYAINKYGINNFTIEQIDVAYTKEELDRKESEWILKLDTVSKGYNCFVSLACKTTIDPETTRIRINSISKNSRILDLTGQKFNRLTVVKKSFIRKDVYWECICDCGNIKIVRASHLKSGDTKSCGCFLKEKNTRHGKIDTREYHIWGGMLAKCNNPKYLHYKEYGGRGIKVCEEWHDFKIFFEDMGLSNGLTLYRIDNSKGYCKENCRWDTMQIQNNNRRDNRHITVEGITKTLAQWARETGIDKRTLHDRLSYGWSEQKAIETPVRRVKG